MRGNNFKKSLAISIIILFIGASILPIICGANVKVGNKKLYNEINEIKDTPFDNWDFHDDFDNSWERWTDDIPSAHTTELGDGYIGVTNYPPYSGSAGRAFDNDIFTLNPPVEKLVSIDIEFICVSSHACGAWLEMKYDGSDDGIEIGYIYFPQGGTYTSSAHYNIPDNHQSHNNYGFCVVISAFGSYQYTRMTDLWANFNIELPTADFTWVPLYPKPSQPITFDASGSYDPDGIILYEWDMDDDGLFDDKTGMNPTWQWSNVGKYNVNLRVTENYGQTDTETKTVYVGVENPPSIGTITIIGLPSDYTNNPVTRDNSQTGNERVKLEATINQALGYEVTNVVWSGDIISGNGNPYYYEASEGTHGKKKVRCTITYKNQVTGEEKSDISLEKNFNLFFIKNGDDDKDKDPNWFEYWQVDDACPNLDECVYGTNLKKEDMGGYDQSTDIISLGPLAATVTDIISLRLKPSSHILTLGGGGLGIDCCYEVVSHELKHKWVWHNNNDVDGIWVDETHSDTDELPDSFEDEYWVQTDDGYGGQFKKDDNDTWDFSKLYPQFPDWIEYEPIADQEVLCRIEQKGKIVASEKDWAFPGKQSNPPYDRSRLTLDSNTNESNSSLNIINVSERGFDSDSDGYYNGLRVTVNLTSNKSMMIQFIAKLFDASQNEISFASVFPSIQSGIQQLQLDFDGVTIRESGINGPYSINVSIYTIGLDGFLLDSMCVSTVSYNYSDFQPQAAVFNGSFTEYSMDNNSDGFYDNLLINVGINVTTLGEYSIGATLYDNTGKIIINTRSTSYLNVGDHIIPLIFDGKTINRHGENGPYQLRYLGLSCNNQTDFILNAYNTSAYNYNSFQSISARFDDNYSDSGLDMDGNGLYEYLSLNVGVNVNSAGNYTIISSLYDSNDSFIVLTSNHSYLNKGDQLITLQFNGPIIFHHNINGSYLVGILTILDGRGMIIDTKTDIYSTSSFNYTSFEENLKPYAPTINGPTSGITGYIYNYSIQTFDPDRDDVYYYVDWDDGTNSGWFGLYNSNEIVYVSHCWIDTGAHEVKVKAKDVYDAESSWSISFNVSTFDIPPRITDNTFMTGTTGDLFIFNTSVIDNIQVSTVCIEYWYDNGTSWNYTMTNTFGDYWEKLILIENTLDPLYYIFSAKDTYNNWNNTIMREITLFDNDPPIWQNQGQNNTFVQSGDNISLYAQGMDNVAIDWAWLATNETGEWQNFTHIWWNKSWNYRIPIIINHTMIKEDLVNFPILINYNSSDFILHSQYDGDDFVFTNEEGLKLNHEIEYYNPTTGKLIVWVKVTSLSSTTDTTLYLYYGNQYIVNQQNATGVWDSNFLGVWHMKESSGTIAEDSTANNKYGIFVGNLPNCVEGKVGFCQDLDGVNDYINLGNSITPSTITAEIWWRRDGTATYQDVLGCHSDGTWNNGWGLHPKYQTRGPGGHIGWGNGHKEIGGSYFPYIQTGIWCYNVLTYDSVINTLTEYLNKSKTSTTTNGDIIYNSNTLIGICNNLNEDWDGTVDEVRISKVVRSTEWIETTYNTINYPTTFISIEPEEYHYGYSLKMRDNNLWQWSNFTWQNSSLPNNTVIGWRIYYIDKSGNINSTDIMNFIFYNPIMSISNSLSSGWNLITIPVDNSWWASNIAENISGCELVSWFDAENQTYKSFIMGGPPEFDFPIINGYGYFVLVTQSSNLNVSGIRISSVSVPLSVDWNMIGWYHDYNTIASSFAENITGCELVSWFNSSSQSFESYIVGGPPEFDFTINPGMGLFVLVNEESVWYGEG
jgi:hypothetical protein